MNRWKLRFCFSGPVKSQKPDGKEGQRGNVQILPRGRPASLFSERIFDREHSWILSFVMKAFKIDKFHGFYLSCGNGIMKNSILFSLLLFLSCAGHTDKFHGMSLMEPEALVEKINQNQAPLILSIGYEALIKESEGIGPAEDSENIDRLEARLGEVSKDSEVVIYCGCCPFDPCPNVRPAVEKVQELGFKNAYLLNLADNIKVDWLDKGYPVNEDFQ